MLLMHFKMTFKPQNIKFNLAFYDHLILIILKKTSSVGFNNPGEIPLHVTQFFH